jgi:membrane protease subunit HflC
MKLFTKSISPFSIVILFAGVMLFFSSVYLVQEGQRGLLLRLGEIVNDKKGKAVELFPGIGFKMPVINQVRLFDVRLQTLGVQSSRILTQEQKYVLVDYYIKWRIENIPLYYQRTSGDKLRAETLLQQQVNDALRAAFGQRTITDMVSGERINVMALLKDAANTTAKNLGISVADVRIKSIDLPEEVSETVFTRMRTKREQVATQHRADGRADAEAIRASADGKAAVTIAEAKTKAANIRAEGSAEAAHIYTEAYGKNPEFYAFYRSLEAYKNSFASKNDFILLTPESEFFKYFNGAVATGAKSGETTR